MELEELSNFRFWVLAQQDPKKFKWSSPDKAGTATNLGDKIIQFAQEKLGATPIKGDIWTHARQKGMQPIYQIQKDDGSLMFVDEAGEQVKVPPGFTFVQSPALKKDMGDKTIFVREG